MKPCLISKEIRRPKANKKIPPTYVGGIFCWVVVFKKYYNKTLRSEGKRSILFLRLMGAYRDPISNGVYFEEFDYAHRKLVEGLVPHDLYLSVGG